MEHETIDRTTLKPGWRRFNAIVMGILMPSSGIALGMDSGVGRVLIIKCSSAFNIQGIQESTESPSKSTEFGGPFAMNASRQKPVACSEWLDRGAFRVYFQPVCTGLKIIPFLKL